MNIAEALERGPSWAVMVDLAELNVSWSTLLRPGQLIPIPPAVWHPVDLAAAGLPAWETARRILEE